METILWGISLGSFWVLFLPQNVCYNSCTHTHICYQFELITYPATHQIVLVSSYHTCRFISLITQHPGLRSWNISHVRALACACTHTHTPQNTTDEWLHGSQEKWWWGLEMLFNLLHLPLSQTVLTLRKQKYYVWFLLQSCSVR